MSNGPFKLISKLKSKGLNKRIFVPKSNLISELKTKNPFLSLTQNGVNHYVPYLNKLIKQSKPFGISVKTGSLQKVCKATSQPSQN